MTDPRLIDMEPGGESTQYESIRQYTISPSKQTGQLGVGQPHTKSEVSPTLGTDTPTSKQNEELQAQSLGMGVFRDSSKEEPVPQWILKRRKQLMIMYKDIALDEDDAAAKARRLQGYGPGSGVGA
ncbi:hypothetical protein N7499_013205 [Penicillium canescens]|uniref:Uncharacterized protein n=1 Tax=Penicillium canescens TaxID=5083 RepID=A0AAD6N5T7_PENCN|nr:hypothetical protein N7522_002179 [Penicillium canescens]KAJ6030790.1 hypothetical protein N7460_011056 [Penicillium canescens]KAJ6064525.1 hypothetical protein N7499_013205 [Penicillium canescens]KAJ6153977.1 hypothetical protein N7485_012346 [Penicillium canescens]